EVAGAGGVIMNGAGKLTLNGINSYPGGTTISGGTLAVNGQTAGILLDGGTLAGSGTVTSINYTAAGGTVSPGDPVGTLNVNGDARIPGLRLEANGGSAGEYDRLNITGSCFATGLLDVIPGPNLQGSTTFQDVIFASGGVSVAFH